MAVKVVDDRAIELATKRAGRVTGMERRILSADGKSVRSTTPGIPRAASHR